MNEKEIEIIEGREVWPIYKIKPAYNQDDKTIKSYCARFNNLSYEKAAKEVAGCERFGNMGFDSIAPCSDYWESVVNREHMHAGDANYKKKEIAAIERAKNDAIKKAFNMEAEMHERQTKLAMQLSDCLACEMFDRCIAISKTRAMSE